MPKAQEEIPVVYVSPTGWIKVNARGRTFYADPNMLMGVDGYSITNIKFYQGHLALQRLGLRSVDDIEYNVIVNTDEGIAMKIRRRDSAVWTGFIRNIQKAKGGGYKVKYIGRPEIVKSSRGYKVAGSEKRIVLPEDGWFKISHLLQSEDGFPHETYKDMPEEPNAYFEIKEGPERPVIRGHWDLDEQTEFGFAVNVYPDSSFAGVGICAASDEKPKLRSPEIQIAQAKMLNILQSLEGCTYDKKVQAKLEVLRTAIEGL